MKTVIELALVATVLLLATYAYAGKCNYMCSTERGITTCVCY